MNLALLNHGSVQIARAALDIEYWADFLPEAEATVILGALLA
jgi:hypothetical protein